MIDLIRILIIFFVLLNAIFILILHEADGFNFDNPKRHFMLVIAHEYALFLVTFFVFTIFHFYLRLRGM